MAGNRERHTSDALLLAVVLGLSLLFVDVILIHLAVKAFGTTLSFWESLIVAGLYRGLKPARGKA